MQLEWIVWSAPSRRLTPPASVTTRTRKSRCNMPISRNGKTNCSKRRTRELAESFGKGRMFQRFMTSRCRPKNNPHLIAYSLRSISASWWMRTKRRDWPPLHNVKEPRCRSCFLRLGRHFCGDSAEGQTPWFVRRSTAASSANWTRR